MNAAIRYSLTWDDTAAAVLAFFPMAWNTRFIWAFTASTSSNFFAWSRISSIAATQTYTNLCIPLLFCWLLRPFVRVGLIQLLCLFQQQQLPLLLPLAADGAPSLCTTRYFTIFSTFARVYLAMFVWNINRSNFDATKCHLRSNVVTVHFSCVRAGSIANLLQRNELNQLPSSEFESLWSFYSLNRSLMFR